MKHLIITFAAMCCILLTKSTNAQATYVVENGVTYTRVFTQSELHSLVGFFLEGENEDNVAAAKQKKRKGNTIDCGRGKGCCLSVSYEMDVNAADVILGISVPQQTLPDGTIINEASGLIPYYNAELDEIIFR